MTGVSIAVLIRRTKQKVADFAGEIKGSLRPQSLAERRLVDEQLSMARAASKANIYVVPVAAIMMAAANASLLPAWRLIGWPLLLTIVCVGSELYYRSLERTADGSAQDIAHRAQFSARSTLAQSILWCGMIYAMWVPGNIENHALLMLAIACSLAGWSSMGAFHLATGAAGMPVYLVAMIAAPLCLEVSGPTGALLAGVCVGYWFLMRTLLFANYRMRKRMIVLEHERGGLIDNLKAAKDESDAARQRAEQASLAKSAFLANMSHELRTPLNAILGFSEIISAKAMGPTAIDQYAEYGGYIHGSGELLLSLINDILDLAKIEAGRLTLREVEIDLRSLMDDAAQMMSTRAVAGGIALAVHVERAFPNIYADERAVRQILVNLASNAIKFTPPGGRVTAFANVLADGSLAFGIDDTGIGIPPEDHAKVFESFGQGRHDAVLADKGTGLGLPIVKGLAEAHGGHVMLHSEPNEGTRITIVLPPERARARLKAAS